MKSLKQAIGIVIGKFIISILKIKKSAGTALPGLIVEKIFPNFIGLIRPFLGKVILITGTNGKTTTQQILTHLLTELDNTEKILVNSKGSNLKRGLISEICRQISFSQFFSRSKFKYTIFEIEEATFPRIASQLSADYLIITNFFRDQLDAYGELNRTKEHIVNGIKNSPSNLQIIINADDPHVLDVIIESKIDIENISGVDINTNSANFVDYESTDSLWNSDVKKEKIMHMFKLPNFMLTNELYPQFELENILITIPIPGNYNYYSFGFAFLLLQKMNIHIELSKVAEIIKTLEPAFGRGEIIKKNNSNYQIFLIKNPVGFNLILKMLSRLKETQNLIIIINDKIADGRDVSWLWDSNIELINSIEYDIINISGSRAKDMLLRLKYAGVNENQLEITEMENIINLPAKDYKIIATYTAMWEVRNLL